MHRQRNRETDGHADVANSMRHNASASDMTISTKESSRMFVPSNCTPEIKFRTIIASEPNGETQTVNREYYDRDEL